MFGKNRRKKGRKTFFIFIRISLQKNAWKKRAKQFLRNTRIVRAKKVGKNRLEKVRNRFLYSHEYRDPKGEEKRAKQVFQKHMNSACKNCWEKFVGVMGKNVFYIHTDIVTKK